MTWLKPILPLSHVAYTVRLSQVVGLGRRTVAGRINLAGLSLSAIQRTCRGFTTHSPGAPLGGNEEQKASPCIIEGVVLFGPEAVAGGVIELHYIADPSIVPRAGTSCPRRAPS